MIHWGPQAGQYPNNFQKNGLLTVRYYANGVSKEKKIKKWNIFCENANFITVPILKLLIVTLVNTRARSSVIPQDLSLKRKTK